MKTFSILILLFVALLAFQAGTLAAETHCEETRAARQAARDNEVKARADWIVARARYNAAIMSYLSGSPSVRKVDGAQRRIDIENAYNASIAAYQAAYRAWRAADIAHDECLLRFRCANGCGAAVDYVTQHLVDPQPECSHRWGVYSCSPSGGSRHTQLVCSACTRPTGSVAPTTMCNSPALAATRPTGSVLVQAITRGCFASLAVTPWVL